MSTSESRLHQDLIALLGPSRVLTRPIDLTAFASDASVYRLVPKAVIRPESIDQIRALFEVCRSHRVPVTFRAAGTSLSGQAVTEGVLADLSRDWRSVEVLDGGRRVRVQPGVIGAAVNARLRPFGAKIGPDPASIRACMMGGILANNSSGMCCGVVQNAYHTLESLVFVLPSGTVVDTADPAADDRLREFEPALAQGLLDLRQTIASDPALTDRIRHKYLTKNTTGYSLNAFLDFERPVEILRHLLVGSEGTLAFIASAVLRTVVDRPVKYTGLLLFPTIRDACAAIVPLRDAGAAAIEVMDRAALRSIERQPGVPPGIPGLPAEAAGLLVEFQAEHESARGQLESAAADATRILVLLERATFTHDAVEQAALWKVRQGMFPSVGATRRRGTAVIIEDVAFPVDRLADAVVDLQALLRRHGYDDAIIFGHARDGNLHFVLTQSFNDQPAIDQYARLMEDVVTLVVRRYDGALKAEHGTGRNIAPFVETEWGPEAFGIMRRLKALVDPDNVLNPGVIIAASSDAHLLHLKSLPDVDESVDKCIECGYCEWRCPSRDLTLTPRQRIVVLRELERLKDDEAGAETLAAIAIDVPYDSLDTCAADGLCATECPVGIDTGSLTKQLRTAHHVPFGHRAAVWAAAHFSTVETLVRFGLRAGTLVERVAGTRTLTLLSRLPRLLLRRTTPLWLAPMPGPAHGQRHNPGANDRATAAAVYLPSCVSRTMGPLPGERAEMSLIEVMTRLAARAQAPIWIPDDAEGHCCGVPFSSKGYVRAHRTTVNRTVNAMWRWTDGGRLPVVVDTSPCTLGLRTCRPALTEENQRCFDRLTILDSIEFTADTLLPRLETHRTRSRVVLHPVCSVVKMGLSPALEKIARTCADDVVVPLDAGCCAFAGDRGWLVPELTASATRREADEVRQVVADGHYSSSRTCEIGLTRATGHVYHSYLYLLEWATREPAKPIDSAPALPIP
ncbi:MAG TPA: FAD-binding and (Fe-S)-binding domain-containing protein [Vicinamibacterales bacterium]